MSAKFLDGGHSGNGQHEGIVRLGELSAPAVWRQEGEILSIRFSTLTMGRDQLPLVHQLKSHAGSVSLALGGKRATSDHHIVCFEDKPTVVTFHVSRGKR